jgi:hypothetical protein
MRRIARSVSMIAVIGALAAPVVLDRDSYPLSLYPMYASSRPSEVSFVTARGLTIDGESRNLSLDLIGASDDPLVVAGELRAAVRRGEADERCRTIATRTAERGPDGIAMIEVVTERHDTVVSLESGESLRDREVHAVCEVGG